MSHLDELLDVNAKNIKRLKRDLLTAQLGREDMLLERIRLLEARLLDVCMECLKRSPPGKCVTYSLMMAFDALGRDETGNPFEEKK